MANKAKKTTVTQGVCTAPSQAEIASDVVTIHLTRMDAGQMLDGLRARRDSWFSTADALVGEETDFDFVLEECSDEHEARQIAEHYASIIRTVEGQLRVTQPSQANIRTNHDDTKRTNVIMRDENIAAISAEMHTSKQWESFYLAHRDELSGFPGFWLFAVTAADAFGTAEAQVDEDTYEYLQAVMDFSESFMGCIDHVPTMAELVTLAEKAIAEAKY